MADPPRPDTYYDLSDIFPQATINDPITTASAAGSPLSTMGLRAAPPMLTPRLEHPPDPGYAPEGERDSINAEWMNLLDYEAFQVASLYRDSPHFEHIHQVLQNPVSRSGQEWHCRVFFTATYIPRWLESRSKSKYIQP